MVEGLGDQDGRRMTHFLVAHNEKMLKVAVACHLWRLTKACSAIATMKSSGRTHGPPNELCTVLLEPHKLSPKLAS